MNNQQFPEFVKGQIYLIEHIDSNMKYVGQTRTYYRSGKVWNKAGYMGRWKAHVSEAREQAERECRLLNNHIRLYGEKAFRVSLILECPIDDLDRHEQEQIAKYGTLSPGGMNLTKGGHTGFITDDQRDMIRDTIIANNDEVRSRQYCGVALVKIHICKVVCGGRDVVSVHLFKENDARDKVDFGGVRTTFEESAKRARKFALDLLPPDRVYVQSCMKPFEGYADLPLFDDFRSLRLWEPDNFDRDRALRFKGKSIQRITISQTTSKGANIICMGVFIEGQTDKVKVVFGGKRTPNMAELANRAYEFAENILDGDSIDKIELSTQVDAYFR